LKNTLFIALLTIALEGTVALAGTGAAGQENNAEPQAAPVSLATPQWSFSPNSIKILGTLNSGQTGMLTGSSRLPEYRAFVFEGNGHDQVDITVTGASRKAYIALADSTLAPITSAMGQLTATLPYHGPDTEAFYILVKGSPNQRLTVHFRKMPPAQQSPDATR
jgi:hypothetical protein